LSRFLLRRDQPQNLLRGLANFFARNTIGGLAIFVPDGGNQTPQVFDTFVKTIMCPIRVRESYGPPSPDTGLNHAKH
jgi:hypothetical protein